MKKSSVLILCVSLVVLFSTSPAMAVDLYGFGSYWEQEEADEGRWGAGIGLSFPIITEHLRLDARAYYFEKSILNDNAELRLIPLDLGLQVHILPDAMFDPYAIGGFSYIFAEADEIDADSDFGGYIGGGLQWAVPNSIVKIFGELAYRFHEVKANDIADIDVSGITANIGIKLHF